MKLVGYSFCGDGGVFGGVEGSGDWELLFVGLGREGGGGV